MSSPYDELSRAREEVVTARSRYQNLRTNPAYQRELSASFAALERAVAHEREALLTVYLNETHRRQRKVLRQFIRSLADLERSEERYHLLGGSDAFPVLKDQLSPPSLTDQTGDEVPTLPAAQRGCAHWEHEGGDPCGKPIFILENGRPSPYCSDHLRVCQNAFCPSGPQHRIPIRFEYCSRCRSRFAPRRSR